MSFKNLAQKNDFIAIFDPKISSNHSSHIQKPSMKVTSNEDRLQKKNSLPDSNRMTIDQYLNGDLNENIGNAHALSYLTINIASKSANPENNNQKSSSNFSGYWENIYF